jgi:hypothetical protein
MSFLLIQKPLKLMVMVNWGGGGLSQAFVFEELDWAPSPRELLKTFQERYLYSVRNTNKMLHAPVHVKLHAQNNCCMHSANFLSIYKISTLSFFCDNAPLTFSRTILHASTWSSPKAGSLPFRRSRTIFMS